jgi:hypothetical protein
MASTAQGGLVDLVRESVPPPHLDPIITAKEVASVDYLAKVLETYAAAGFRQVVRWLPSAGRGPVERALDRHDVPLGDQVYEWTRTMEHADAIVRQHERFFLARVGTACRDLGEVAAMHTSDGIAAWHWWTLAEMDSSAEVIWPPGLANLIRSCIHE